MRLLKVESRDDCRSADEVDSLRDFRDKFLIPEGLIYMTGNSLGLCPRGAQEAASRIITEEWGKQTIEAWSRSKWFISSELIGNKLGKLVGADIDETVIAESTSVSIFKCLASAIAIQKIYNPDRRVIVLERENFPTDNYIAEGLLNLMKTDEYKIRYFDNETPLEEAVRDDTVLVLLSLVNYRTGLKFP